MPHTAAFRTFLSFDEAGPAMHALDLAGIPYRMVHDRPPVDVTFNLDGSQDRVLMFVQEPHFERAEKAIKVAESPLDATPEAGHYLRFLTDGELLDILACPDEWTPQDAEMAERFLEERGVKADAAEIRRRREKRMKKRSEPVAAKPMAVLGCYLLSLGGGVLGIVMGWGFATATEKDGAGNSYYYYDRATRRHGWAAVALGVVSAVVWVWLVKTQPFG